MDIQQVNAVLTRAIDLFQAEEIEDLWEKFNVPSPQEMHRRHGMSLPPEMMVDQAEAESKAAKSQADLQRVFDQLKPKQVIWVAYQSYSISGPRKFHPYTVGRRGRSKKYGTTSITLLARGQQKPAHRGMQTHLYKDKDGEIRIAEGDLAAGRLKIYVP